MIKKILFISLITIAMLFSVFSSNSVKASSDNNMEKEIIELRGQNYKVFEKNNKRLIQYYFSPIHYATSNGFAEYDYNINEFDNSFEKNYDKYNVIFPKMIRSGKYIEYNFNNEKVEFTLNYKETLYGEISYIDDEQILVYRNIKGITCLEIEIHPEYIKIYDLKKCNNFGQTEINFKNEKESNTAVFENKIGYVVNNKTFLIEISSLDNVNITEKENIKNNNTTLMRTNQLSQDISTYTLETTDVENPQVMTITNTTVNVSDHIEDKFIVEEIANYSYTLSELRNNKIGLKSSGFVGENEEPISVKMKQIINLDPIMNKLILTPEVESFKLIYTRTGGRQLSSMYGVTLYANRITSDLEYSNINGTTTYNTEFINNMTQYNSIGYEVDLTESVNEYIETQDTESFLVEIDSSGFVTYNTQAEDVIQFGSSRHTLKKPYILIEFGTSNLGAALEQGTVEGEILGSSQNGIYNCFGYALNKIDYTQLVLPKEDYQSVEFPFYSFEYYVCYKYVYSQNGGDNQLNAEDLIQLVIDSANYHCNVSLRLISSSEDLVYNHEYRIAFRIGNCEDFKSICNLQNGPSDLTIESFENASSYSHWYMGMDIDFHFLRQNKLTTGILPRWSGKNGENDITPLINILTYNWNGFYDSETVYFAVSVL